MSKFKKLYLLLLVSAAMNISNVYASAETDDTDTRTASSSSSDSSPASTSTFMPVQYSQFVTQVSDKPADYIITVPGKTYGEVSRILDFTFKSLGVRTPSVLNKIMEEYEASPSDSSFLYCFKRDSNMVTVINTDSAQTVADIKFDSRPNCAMLSGSKLYVFESSGNISIIGTDTPPYKTPYTEIRCGSNPRCVTSIGNKLAVTCDNGIFLLDVGVMQNYGL
ncbi:MAG: hypothetical protein NT128_03845 [Proteobacteria bacterium]|nr:hypothetical protein [Pseudomonadota bacterium]